MALICPGKAASRTLKTFKTSWNHQPGSAIDGDVTSFRTVEKFREKDLCVLKLLGSGSFSNVSQACDKKDNDRIFAIKRLKPSVRVNRNLLPLCAADFAIETAILANLDHENIIALHGIKKGSMIELLRNGDFFIVIEPLCETLEDRMGRWRKEWMRQRRFSNVEKKFDFVKMRLQDVALGIVKGMEYLHSKRVIYRDLKPANIGFDTVNDRIKIFDFGLSRVGLCNEEGANGKLNRDMTTKIGTPKYMAPEIARGDADYGYSVDVYSFSIVFWQLVTNRIAFEKMSSTSKLSVMIAEQHLRPSLKYVKLDSLKELIETCWSNDPDDRPTFTTIREKLEYMIENPSSLVNSGSSNLQSPRQRNFGLLRFNSEPVLKVEPKHDQNDTSDQTSTSRFRRNSFQATQNDYSTENKTHEQETVLTPQPKTRRRRSIALGLVFASQNKTTSDQTSTPRLRSNSLQETQDDHSTEDKTHEQKTVLTPLPTPQPKAHRRRSIALGLVSASQNKTREQEMMPPPLPKSPRSISSGSAQRLGRSMSFRRPKKN